MLILGIDQSYTSTGIVVIENDNILLAERFASNKEDTKFYRSWEIKNYIKEVVEKYNPERVAIEGLAFGMRGDATRDLAGLQFVIVNELMFVHNLEVVVVSPKSLKLFATGSGKAKKKEMIEALPTEVHQLFTEELVIKKTKGLDDVTDAYWLAKYIMEKK